MCVCVCVLPPCPISYLSSLVQRKFFSLAPTFSSVLFHFFIQSLLQFPSFSSSFHLITFLSLPILPFLCPCFFCLPQTWHTYTCAHTCWKQIREANSNCCQLNINAVHFLNNNNTESLHSLKKCLHIHISIYVIIFLCFNIFNWWFITHNLLKSCPWKIFGKKDKIIEWWLDEAPVELWM